MVVVTAENGNGNGEEEPSQKVLVQVAGTIDLIVLVMQMDGEEVLSHVYSAGEKYWYWLYSAC